MVTDEMVREYMKWQKNPLQFIWAIWGLRAQEVHKEYEPLLMECRRSGDYSRMKLSMFEKF